MRIPESCLVRIRTVKPVLSTFTRSCHISSPYSSTSGHVLHKDIWMKGEKTLSRCACNPVSTESLFWVFSSLSLHPSHHFMLWTLGSCSLDMWIFLFLTTVCWVYSPVALGCLSALSELTLLGAICSSRVLMLLYWGYTLIVCLSTKTWNPALSLGWVGPYIFSRRLTRCSPDSVIYWLLASELPPKRLREN